MDANLKSNKQQTRDRSWIWAIIVVSLFLGVRVCTRIIEKENERRLMEIVDKCGGEDNFRRLLMGEDAPEVPKAPQLTLTPELIEQLNQ